MTAPEVVQAETYYGIQRPGRCMPVRMTCRKTDGSSVDLIVKLKGGPLDQGVFGLASELFCSRLASRLGLSCPEPYLVEIPAGFHDCVSKDARGMVERSVGVSFGSSLLDKSFNLFPPHATFLPTNHKQTAAEIFAFDSIIRNYDRKSDNPNLLWNREEIFLIDHERALGSIRSLEALGLQTLELDKMYNHVCWPLIRRNVSLKAFEQKLEAISSSTLLDIISQIPDNWLKESESAKLLSYFEWIIERRTDLCNLVKERFI